MRFRQGFTEHQAEPQAAKATADARLALLEGIEYPLHGLRPDANAGVGNADLNSLFVVIAIGAFDHDLAARRREFGGVAKQIPEDLPQPCRIAADKTLLGMQTHHKPQLPRIDFRSADLHDVFHGAVQIDRLRLNVQLALGDARDVQQIVDQPRFDLDITANEPRVLANLRRRFRSEEHTSELQSLRHLVCRLLLEKKKKKK